MGGKLPISVAVITLNEEKAVRECLESVLWAEEIVVGDSGSTDGTEAACREYTDRLVVHEWEGYVGQKNYARSLCRNDWVLSLDADERVTAELAAEIKELFSRAGGPEADGYYMPRKLFYLGRYLTHGGWYPDKKLRLFKKDKGRWVGGRVHERVELEGRTGQLRGDIIHLSYEDIRDHVMRVERFASLSAEDKRGSGTCSIVLRMVLEPPLVFVKKYLLRLGFLDGVPGLVAAWLSGVHVFLKYAKCWELRREEPRRGDGV